MEPTQRLEIVFVGGGHSHCLVARDLLERFKQELGVKSVDHVHISMISNSVNSLYSGMLPACVAGIYEKEELTIYLPDVCAYYGIDFVEGTVTQISSTEKVISFYSHGERTEMKYDILSLDVGSANPSIPGLPDFTNCIATRPISEFLSKVEQFEVTTLNTEETSLTNIHVVVVGAGAAGVELAMAFQARYQKRNIEVQTTLISDHPRLLSDMGSWVSSKVHSTLEEKKINVILNHKAIAVQKDCVMVEHVSDKTQKSVPFQLLIWATGAAASELLEHTDLQRDEHGFILVSPTLQSISSPCVFASGDCACLSDFPYVKKAGVFAVREAPVLLKNIVAMGVAQLKHQSEVTLTPYTPQYGFLSLLMTGDGEAIASWKGIALKSWWLWKLKDKIDKDFMQLFQFTKDDKT